MRRRIGLNLLYLVPGEVGGSEVYARSLVRALRETAPDLELVAYAGPEAASEVAGWAAGVQVRTSPVPSRVKPLRVAAELSWLPRRARRDRIELLHSLGTTAPLRAAMPSVVTVHDVIYHDFPKTFPRAARLGLELVVPRAARRADRVIAISEACKADVVRVLGVPAGQVVAVPQGFGHERSRAGSVDRFGVGGDPVVLAVSAALEHKNLTRLLAAFAGGPAATSRLVVVGHRGLEMDALRRRAGELGLGDRVVFTGWVEKEELEALYERATVFAYPTLSEGFGLPLLEAMRRDVPVACSDIPVLREVAGDAAEFFDPHSVEAIRAALERLLADAPRRAELVERGRARWPEFTWDRTARGTLAVYEEVLCER